VAVSYKHSNNISSFIEGGEFIDELSKCQLLNKDYAPWSQRVANEELRKIWKEVVVAYFMWLLQTLPWSD
jgi:hypothetical protein